MAGNKLNAFGITDEKFTVGERQDALKVVRTFMCNGKKIGQIKSKETSKITFLKLNVNDKQETFCPNCGSADYNFYGRFTTKSRI